MRILLSGLFVVLSGFAAVAAPPSLGGGRYAFHSQSSCEARFNVTAAQNFLKTNGAGGMVTGPGVVSVVPGESGLLSAEIGYIAFTPGTLPNSGTFAITNRSQVEGGALRVNNSGLTMAVGSGDLNGAYIISDTQLRLTIQGQAGTLVFSMVHSNRGRNLYLVMRENARCFNLITATK